jgi:hypothetical protein
MTAAILATALLAQNIPFTRYLHDDMPSGPVVPGVLDPRPPPPLKDPNAWVRALDPNRLKTEGPGPLLFIQQHYPQTLTAGQYTQFKLTQHACGCMEVPLAQGAMVLPCKAHDRKLHAIWKKGDAEGPTGW